MTIEEPLKDSNPEHIAAVFLRVQSGTESPELLLPLGLVYHSSQQHSSDGSDQDGELKDHFTYLPHHISKSFSQ